MKEVLFKLQRIIGEVRKERRYYGSFRALLFFFSFCTSFFIRHIVKGDHFTNVPLEKAEEVPNSSVIDTMYVERRINTLSPGTEITFYVHLILSLGDVVACEPVARYLKKRWPHSKIVWIVRQDYEALLTYNPFIDTIMTVSSLGESSQFVSGLKADDGEILVDLHFNGLRCEKTGIVHHNNVNPFITFRTYLNYGNLLEAFCLAAGLPKLNWQPVFYLAPSIEVPKYFPERYVVFHCKSNVRIKNWTKKKWNILAKYLLQRGVRIVEIGKEQIIQSKSKLYYNSTDIHNIQQVAKIIKGASCFVGIDSGFAHIANCFAIPAVLIFGIYYHYTDYKIYSGNYAESKSCTILFDHKYGSFHVKVKQVEKAVEKYLSIASRDKEHSP